MRQHALVNGNGRSLAGRFSHGHSIAGNPVARMRKKIATAFACLVVLTAASTVLTACNTIEGAGKDVSKAGTVVSEEAKEHK